MTDFERIYRVLEIAVIANVGAEFTHQQAEVLLSEINRLRAALDYYQNPAMYTVDPRNVPQEIIADGGSVARHALEGAK